MESSLSGEEAAEECKAINIKKCCRNTWFEYQIFATRGDLSWGISHSFSSSILSSRMTLVRFSRLSSHFCRNGSRRLLFAASTEHHEEDMLTLQTYVLPNPLADRELQATWCILLLNLQNLMVILTLKLE